jgi:hypothetical protein
MRRSSCSPFQERRDRPAVVEEAVKAILDAAEKGRGLPSPSTERATCAGFIARDQSLVGRA